MKLTKTYAVTVTAKITTEGPCDPDELSEVVRQALDEELGITVDGEAPHSNPDRDDVAWEADLTVTQVVELP